LARFGLLVIALWTGTAAAQEVDWRQDYNTARREAQSRGLPLILDFGTDNCFWCKKLDETTLRDPTVASILSQRFVALRVDATRNAALAEALRIQTYPTVVLAGPDGKILGTLEGFVESGRFVEHLQRALISLGNPEWMTRDFEEAGRAAAAADYTRAVALLKSIVEDGKNRPVQVKAQRALNDLERQAAGCLTRAKQLEDKGQTTAALEALTALLRQYGGTQAATEAGQMITTLTPKPALKAEHRTRRARELLAEAREDYRTKQYLGCMDKCELLAASYGDLPEGADALQLAADIKNNPEWMRQACDALGDRLANLYLALAETLIKRGEIEQAVAYLERVVRTLPGTTQSETAQTRLGQLQGQSTQRMDFKKP
jgi:thioredoxin-like negative regulator of GroEL